VALGGRFSSPTNGIAVDGSGNVYVSETGNVTEMPAGCFSSSCVTSVGSGFVLPSQIAVDGNGNIFVSDGGNATVHKIDVQDMPSLIFASTPAYTSSAQQVVTLGNNGNLPLTISALPGTNASFAGSRTTCSTSATVAAGLSCALGVEFAPTAAGNPLTGSASISDNSLNANPSATQSIAVSGIATLSVPTITGVSPASLQTPVVRVVATLSRSRERTSRESWA
jgi:hypothetical protein